MYYAGPLQELIYLQQLGQKAHNMITRNICYSNTVNSSSSYA